MVKIGVITVSVVSSPSLRPSLIPVTSVSRCNDPRYMNRMEVRLPLYISSVLILFFLFIVLLVYGFAVVRVSAGNFCIAIK